MKRCPDKLLQAATSGWIFKTRLYSHAGVISAKALTAMSPRARDVAVTTELILIVNTGIKSNEYQLADGDDDDDELSPLSYVLVDAIIRKNDSIFAPVCVTFTI